MRTTGQTIGEHCFATFDCLLEDPEGYGIDRTNFVAGFLVINECLQNATDMGLCGNLAC